MRSAFDQRAAVRFGLVWVCEVQLSKMGKNNGNPDLVCETFNSLNELDLPKFDNHTDLPYVPM